MINYNLKEYYNNIVIDKLKKQFRYHSVMQVPKIKKVTLNMGIGKSVSDKKILDHAINDLKLISGQKPILTKSRKSISNFKIRKNYSIGCKVTLRRNRMWDFLDRLIFIAIPRIRDFRGFSIKSFDNQGNYNVGIREQIIFPEIDYDKIDRIRGLDIAITTNAGSILMGKTLLSTLNFPFKK